jgi:hypothetical protein
VEERLPSKHEALSSNPNSAKKKKSEMLASLSPRSPAKAAAVDCRSGSADRAGNPSGYHVPDLTWCHRPCATFLHISFLTLSTFWGVLYLQPCTKYDPGGVIHVDSNTETPGIVPHSCPICGPCKQFYAIFFQEKNF